MSVASQETVPNAVTSTVPQQKELNAETVTTMATAFLKRIGHKGGLKPRRVSLEGEVYTVEVETKKFTAVVRIGNSTREIREYDVQPKSEESSFSVNPKMILIIFAVSAAVTAGFHFMFPIIGL
ncbi:DUF3606 domain-containing protein [Candidatus Bathyarchaeota archaeon A05DMB-2]|nr:DUF3606 domain-containing protein [Candidatus Bathyarchaeota archaeon A05DMB-2]